MSNHKPLPNTLIIEPDLETSPANRYLVSAIYPSSVASGAVTLAVVTENQGGPGILLDLDDATALRDHLNTLIEQAEIRAAFGTEVPC